LGYPIFICPRGKENYGHVVFQSHKIIFYSSISEPTALWAANMIFSKISK
jgi:hypothetical protein